MTTLDSILKSRNITLPTKVHLVKAIANKGPSSQSYGFSSSHVWMRALDCKKRPSAEELMLLNFGVGEDS